MAYDYEYFKREMLILSSIDLNCYKESQMKRRIDTLIAKHKIEGYKEYIEMAKKEQPLLEEFVSYITINVSEFYRNPDQWKVLDSEVIPELINRFGNRLKIWSAACSTGEEPYSLALALSKHIPLSKIHIMATDLDKNVIEKAKIGMYGEKSVRSVPEDLKKRYFTKIGPSYKISEEIKACVEFKQHDLLKDPYIKGCHLIVCRNVLIYFTEDAKSTIYQKFYSQLESGGNLFIGSTEQIMYYKAIGYEKNTTFFYRKP